MENVLKQVIESEYRAQKIISEAKYEIKQSAENLQNEIDNIKEKIFSTAKKAADEIKTSKHKQAEQECEKIMLMANEKADHMKKSFIENREIWVKTLFEKVINDQ